MGWNSAWPARWRKARSRVTATMCRHCWNRLDVFCLCSPDEGLPISILEAMRAGLPVIVSDGGGVGEAVAQGHTGLLVAHNDVVS